VETGASVGVVFSGSGVFGVCGDPRTRDVEGGQLMRKLVLFVVGLLVGASCTSAFANDWRDVANVYYTAASGLGGGCFLWVDKYTGSSSGSKYLVKARCGGTGTTAVTINYRRYTPASCQTETHYICNGTLNTGGGCAYTIANFYNVGRIVSCGLTESYTSLDGPYGGLRAVESMCWIGTTAGASCTGLDTLKGTVDNVTSNDCVASVVNLAGSWDGGSYHSAIVTGACDCIPEGYIPVGVISAAQNKCEFRQVVFDPGTVGGQVLVSATNNVNGVGPVQGEIAGLPNSTGYTGPGDENQGGSGVLPGSGGGTTYSGGEGAGGASAAEIEAAVAAALAGSNLSRLTQSEVSAAVSAGLSSYGAAKGSDIPGGVSSGLSSYGAAKSSDVSPGVSSGLGDYGAAKGSDVSPGVSSGLESYGAAKGSDIGTGV
jgi:hypothetical protein